MFKIDHTIATSVAPPSPPAVEEGVHARHRAIPLMVTPAFLLRNPQESPEEKLGIALVGARAAAFYIGLIVMNVIVRPGGEPMMQKKKREKVVAEITTAHLMQLMQEQGMSLDHRQALDLLNEDGRAYVMWKHMMYAGEDYIRGVLAQNYPAQSQMAPSR